MRACPSFLMGLGYEPEVAGLYVMADFEAFMYGGESQVIFDWGPTLTIGHRF